MKSMISLGAIALALALTGCGGGGSANQTATSDSNAALPQIPAPNNGDWTEVISETEQGYRMGNPDAPVKFVEYASITCPHCAEFAESATEELENTFVRSGQVSYEYRPYLIFPTDPGIFALLRCQGATPFFRLVDQLYASQRDWAGRLQSVPQAQLEATQNMPPTQRAQFLVRSTGLDQFFRQRGMPESRLNSCLADNANLAHLADLQTRAINQDSVQGTPTFFLNGERVDAGTWPEVEQRLRGAIGG